jgi:hypothetical protein
MSGVSKKRRFLSPDGISELFWNSESEDTGVSSDSTSEDEGDFQGARGVTPATGTPNIQWSSVQQFDLNKCL